MSITEHKERGFGKPHLCQTAADREQERRQCRIISSSFWQNGQVGETLTPLCAKSDLVGIEQWQAYQIKISMLTTIGNFQVS